MRTSIRTFGVVGTVAAAVGIAAVWVGNVDALTQSAPLSVTATVNNNCTISTAPVAFGSYDPVVAHASGNLDGNGSVTIACTKGSTTPIDLNFGSNASGSTRRMAAGGEFLAYELYKDVAGGVIWGVGANGQTPPAAPNKNGRSFTVYGRVPSGQDVPAGSYTDSVTATVNF